MENNFKSDRIKLIIGLGNPDKKYKNTYHNAGFLFIDYLKKQQPAISDFPASLASQRETGRQFLISKPVKSETHMNLSGNFVKKEMKGKNVKPEQILIVHDDSDLALGDYKIVFDRGAAGHKGVSSIIYALKTKKFWRLRIGTRTAEIKNNGLRIKAGDFALKNISAKDGKILEKTFLEITNELNR